MKKKLSDFGEFDKIDEEALGLERDEKKDSFGWTGEIISFMSFGGMIISGLFCCLSLIVIFGRISKGTFSLSSFSSAEIQNFFFLIFCLVMRVVGKLLLKKSANDAVSHRKMLMSTVKPTEGKIFRIVQSNYYTNGRFTESEWVVFVEYYNESRGEKQTLQGCTFKNDVSKYLCGDKVNIYFEPGGRGYEIADFEFRNKDNSVLAKIPLYVNDVRHTRKK